MYTLTRAMCRKDRRQGRWVECDLTDEPINTLIATHGDVWLFIDWGAPEGEYALDIDSVRNMISVVKPGVTVSEWLENLGNETLPFEENLPTFNTHYVRYIHAWTGGYEIIPISRNGTIAQDVSAYSQDDLLIRRPTVDHEYLATNALFTVNGLFHRASEGVEGVHIIDGNRSLRRANENQVGVYSFSEVGEVDSIPITEEMVHSYASAQPLRRGAYLRIPDDVELENKTVLLVIGGYLQVLGDTYQRVGERHYRVHINKLHMRERYYDSCKDIDLSSLGLTEYDHNDSLLSKDALTSDQALRAYLTLPQSFFVVVDAPSFFQDLEALEETGLPNRYLDHAFDYAPVMGTYGRMLEYHAISENGVHVLATNTNVRHSYDFHHRPAGNYDDGRYPYKPFVYAPAWKRILGVQK